MQKTDRQELGAYQASRRGGVLHCRLAGDRVLLAGQAALYAKAELYLPEACML